jgi:hypothetical protein
VDSAFSFGILPAPAVLAVPTRIYILALDSQVDQNYHMGATFKNAKSPREGPHRRNLIHPIGRRDVRGRQNSTARCPPAGQSRVRTDIADRRPETLRNVWPRLPNPCSTGRFLSACQSNACYSSVMAESASELTMIAILGNTGSHLDILHCEHIKRCDP